MLSGVGGLLGVAVGFAIPRIIIFFIQDQKAIVTVDLRHARVRDIGGDRDRFRHLSRTAGGLHGPDRGTPPRIG